MTVKRGVPVQIEPPVIDDDDGGADDDDDSAEDGVMRVMGMGSMGE